MDAAEFARSGQRHLDGDGGDVWALVFDLPVGGRDVEGDGGYNVDGELGDSTGTNRSTPVAVSTLTNVVQIAAGAYHTLAKKSNGSLWAWGLNGTDQLGGGGHNSESAPIAISPPSVVDQIGSGPGALHSLAATGSGILYAWGDNAFGKLGDGTTIVRSVPTAVTGADGAWNVGTPTLSVASGTYSVEKSVTVSVTTPDATIHYTQNGSEPTENDPTVASGSTVEVTASQTLTAKAFKSGSPSSNAVSAAYTLSVAIPSITPNGGSFTSAPSVSMATTSPGVTLRYTLDGSTPTASSSAYASAITIGTTTTVKVIGFRSGWTTSAEKSAGFTMTFGTLSTPTASPGTGSYTGTTNVSLSSIAGATIRYTTNGAPVSTSSPIYSSPIPISVTTTLKAKAYHPDYNTSPEASWTYTTTAATPTLDLASGSYAPGSAVTITHADALAVIRMTIDGTDPTTTSQTVTSGTTVLLGDFTLKVRAWRTGAADSAVGSATYTLTSALGPGQITAGDAHTVLVTPEGLVFAWGLNTSNQLGDGTATQRTTPTLVSTVTGVVSVSAGATHTLALTYDGHVFAWGNNGSGRLGDGTTTNRSKPTLIPTLSNIVAISAGSSHSLALDASGQMYAWGLGTSGQLGNGASSNSSTPVAVSLSNVAAIAAGGTHSLAVTTTGAIYSWGADASSQLGDGGTTARNTPWQITGLTEVASVSAGTAHSMARRQNGEIFVWGSGANGRLGLGSTSNQTTPALLSGSQEVLIAAGGTHSVVLKATGALRAWGANGSGQVGDSSLTQRTAPVAVSGSFNVSALAAGALHSVAVDGAGVVRAWGEAGSHQLGTGSTTDQQSPIVIWTAPGRWSAPPPTISLAPGTYTTDQIATVTDAVSGTVVRYSTNGADPTDSDTQVPTNGEVAITRSMTFKVRAFLSDRRPSAVASAAYILRPVTPTIAPAAGQYTSAQAVMLSSSESNVTIRYTLDASDPSASSIAYTTAFSVGTSVTVKAKAFRADGSISDLSSAAYTFNYGTLSTPVASPGAGPFQTAPQVTLSADTASTIHYTLDGSDPTASSTLYSGAISIASGGQTLKARAFEQDWTASAALTAAYAIDNADPTIVADVFPALQNGWMSTPVTVSFRCNDASGIASCSSPTTFSSEGANQTVTGTAVDLAGNDVSIVVTVSLDLAPPVVTLTSPADRTVTSATTIQLTGAVSDALSGVVSAKCNGVTATIDNGAVTCTVVLHPGRNAVVLQASDAAGHSSSTGVTVTRVGTASHVMLSPATRTLLVDESTTLSLLDDFGVAVFGATWTSSDTDILTLSNDDPPVLTAIADGEATLTATKNGLTSEATITVVTGTTLVDGTTHWTVAPIPNVIMGSPIYTNRVDLSVPDMFTVETDATTGAITMRAVGADGIAQWSMEAPGIPLMGDSFGGVIGGELYDPEIDFDYRALIRFGGPTTAAPWRYESAGSVARPAQGPDGTIYAIEFLDGGLGPQGNRIWDKHAVVLNGSNGQLIARVPLAREEWRWDAVREGQLQFITSGQPCASNVRQYVPPTVGPIVNADGQGYFIVRQRTRIGHVDCLENYPAHGAGESDVNLILLRLSPDGVATTNVINAQHCTDVLSQGNSCDVPPTPDQLVPDGLGGMLATATYTTVIFSSNQFYEEKRLTRLDGIGGKVEHVIGQYDRIAMIGDVGTVFLQNVSGIEAVDGLTLASKFTASDVVPVMAQIGGGLAAQAAVGDSMTFFSDNGTVLGQVNMPLVTPNPEVSVGSLTGLTNGSIGMIEASQVDPIVGEFNVLTHGSRSGQDSQYQSLPTIQAAAVARLRSYNFRSIRVNVEFGGSICRTPQNRFIGTYSRPVERATGSDDVDPTTCSSLFAIPELPLAGRYHTHGRDGNVGLSWGDVGHAHDNPTIPWFVASPCGGIYEYSGFTSPRPWYTWLPRAIDLDAIYGKPLPERTTTPLQNPCPVDIGIIYPPPQ